MVEPEYMPLHLVADTDELDRALNAKRRALRRHPAPWSQPQVVRATHPDPLEETTVFTNLPDVVYKVFWTLVAGVLGYLATVQIPDVGPEWTPVIAAVWTAVLVAARHWVDKRTATPTGP